MTMALRALIWIAVSSEKQAGDKVSLTEQERAGREWAEANGYEVVGVLSVPGESRSETDVLTIFEEFAEKQVFAYHDLRKMWQSPRQFDVLVAYHDSRLGRSEALFAYVVTNVMKAGAKIYTILGGWYVPDEYQMKMFMGMASVTNEMKRFVSLTKAVKLDKAAKGTLVHGHPCWAYKVERGTKGEALRKIPDESKRLVIEAAARLVIEGVGWKHIEKELCERFGIVNKGKLFTTYTFYFLFHNPNFHGNEVIQGSHAHRRRGLRNHIGNDLWVFDPSYALPEGTQIFYNVLQPYFPEGNELGEQLKTELRRRRHSMRGTARAARTHKFVGLMSCYYCGRAYVFHPNGRKKYPYYQCQSKYNSSADDRCTRLRLIPEKEVQAWFDVELRKLIKVQDPEWFLRRDDEQARAQQLAQLQAKCARLNQLIDRTLDEQLTTDDEDIRQRLRARRSEYSADLAATQQQILALETQNTNDASGARQAYERLMAFDTLEKFWAAPGNQVNQILHGLMGEKVIVIKDREIKGSADRPR